MVVAYLLGVPIGMFVGYVGGRADALADFVVNVLFAIPALVVVLAVSVVTDNNLPFMTVVFGVIVSGGIFRLVRASTQASRDLLYVDAARVSGVSRWTILLRHILPNVLGPLIVQGFLLYSGAFLFLTSLSFLGLGFDPQQPSWGQLVFDASAHLDDDPWLMVPIGVVLIATVAALNYLGNSLLATLPTAKRARLLTPPRRPVLPSEAAAGTAPEGRRTPAAAEPVDADAPLVVEDLVVSFRTPEGGWQPVVDGVSFAVHRGETLCLVGESGCGKTMTALATLGLLPEGGAAAGSVRLAGRELLDLSEKEMAQVRGSQIALMSQEPMGALDPCFSVRSQLGDVVNCTAADPRRECGDRVHELLRLVGIPERGVGRQELPAPAVRWHGPARVHRARAGREPSVLVADEPTTALDPTIQAEILDLLRSLQRRWGWPSFWSPTTWAWSPTSATSRRSCTPARSSSWPGWKSCSPLPATRIPRACSTPCPRTPSAGVAAHGGRDGAAAQGLAGMVPLRRAVPAGRRRLPPGAGAAAGGAGAPQQPVHPDRRTRPLPGTRHDRSPP